MTIRRTLTDLSSPFGLLEASRLASRVAAALASCQAGNTPERKPFQELADLLPWLLSAHSLKKIDPLRLEPIPVFIVGDAIRHAKYASARPPTVAALANLLQSIQSDLQLLAKGHSIPPDRIASLAHFCNRLADGFLNEVTPPPVAGDAYRI